MGLGAIARRLSLAALVTFLLAGVPAAASAGDETDPVRNTPLACEYVNLPIAHISRAASRIEHVANTCGIVGTDIELQSRYDTAGKKHDYAFLGTMGAGLRIFDITNPAHPTPAGAYADPGWEFDVQIRGNLALGTFDGVAGEPSTGSTCLKTHYPGSNDQGVDFYKLDYDSLRATFTVSLLTCIANPPGGAHNSTLNPTGRWLAISNCCSDWAIDVIDLRDVFSGKAVHRYRLIDPSRVTDARCPASATFKCIVMKRPNGASASGLWRPHDVHFSKDGNIAFVAAINSSWIVDVSQVLSGIVKPLAYIPNNLEAGGESNPHNVSISHQADVSSDGAIMVISDERGGGLDETRCNTDPAGVIGGLHFFAVKPIPGFGFTSEASLRKPILLGHYFTPQPLLAYDVLQAAIDNLPRTERGCTIHVFRMGGNGTASPGPVYAGMDGVSNLPVRQMTAAHYGAGTWWIDFSGRPSNADGVKEDPRTTWGNTLGWNVMPGADTWSAKEYRGYVFTGDMLRGMDVFRLVKTA